jgi:tRNA G46 methylase TrmB
MTASQARSITSNQSGVHADLIAELAKHRVSDFKRPIAEHTKQAFIGMLEWLEKWDAEVILDACCGVGESTINIAKEFPNARVIGVDKSIARLEKHKSYVSKADNELATNNTSNDDKNYLLVQADLNDFWRLLVAHIADKQPTWQVVKQFILYPNPYPKKAQLGKRWHGSALFPFIVASCPTIEVRSNWRVYLEEFAVAADFYGLHSSIEDIPNSPSVSAYTPFERKYLEAHQRCFKLVILPLGTDK